MTDKEWIPLTKNLPLDLRYVLITSAAKGVLMGRYFINGKWLVTDGIWLTDVIAWMELPEPYKPENK